MATLQVSVVSAAAATNTPVVAIRAGANRIRIKTIKVVNATAVLSQIGLVRPASLGTPSASVLGQANQATDAASATNIDTAWSVPPSAGTVYLERASLGAVIGNGDVWSFPDEVYIEPTQSLLIWNWGSSTSGQVQVSVTYEE